MHILEFLTSMSTSSGRALSSAARIADSVRARFGRHLVHVPYRFQPTEWAVGNGHGDWHHIRASRVRAVVAAAIRAELGDDLLTSTFVDKVMLMLASEAGVCSTAKRKGGAA